MRATPSSASLHVVGVGRRRLAAAAAMSTLLLHALCACTSDQSPHHEEETQYGFDITKPLIDSEDATQELADLDAFARSAAVTPLLLYLPIHIRVSLTDEQMQRYGGSMRLDDCYTGVGLFRSDAGKEYHNCDPTYLSGDELLELRDGGIVDTGDRVDESRALTNFVRAVIGHQPFRFSQALPAVATSRAIADPCDYVAPSGRDGGWVTGKYTCVVNPSGEGLAPLTDEELQSFRAETIGAVLKNQPSPQMRTRSGESYFEYVSLRPPRYAPTRNEDPAILALIARGKYKYPDEERKLSPLERQVVRGVFAKARRGLARADSVSVANARKIQRVRFDQTGWFEIAAPVQQPGVVRFPPTAVRASFLQCRPEIQKLLDFSVMQQQCKEFGGELRRTRTPWPQSSHRYDVVRPEPENPVRRAREQLQELYCPRVRRLSYQLELVNKFNACVVDQLWFLMNHEMAHIYLGASRTVESNEYRADCYGVMNALRTRPGSSLGVFETIVVQQLASSVSGGLGPRQAREIGLRHEGLKATLLPLARSDALSPGKCEEYAAAAVH